MADPLDVRFTSNAPEITPGVEKLASATSGVDTAQIKAARSGGDLASALTKEARAAAQAAKATLEYRSAMAGLNRDTLTGGSSVSPRVKALQDEAAALSKRRQLLGSIARAGGGSADSSNEVVRSARNHSALDAVLKRIGGSVAHAGGGFMHYGMVMGAATLAIVAARIVGEQYLKHLDHEKEILGDVIDRQNELKRARRDSNAELQKQGADAAASQGQALRRVIARGGSLSQVDALNKQGVTGAAEGLSALQDIRDPRSRQTAQEAAIKAQRLGHGTFAENAKALAEQGGIFQGDSDRTTAQLLSRGARTRTSAEDVRKGLVAVGANPITGALDTLDRIGGQKEGVVRSRIPQGVGEARADLARTIDPYTAKLVDIALTSSEQLAKLKEVADLLGPVSNFFDRAAKGTASAQGKYADELRKQGAVAAGL